MERESLEMGNLEQAEILNEQINEYREKEILLKSLIVIEDNENAVFIISLKD